MKAMSQQTDEKIDEERESRRQQVRRHPSTTMPFCPPPSSGIRHITFTAHGMNTRCQQERAQARCPTSVRLVCPRTRGLHRTPRTSADAHKHTRSPARALFCVAASSTIGRVGEARRACHERKEDNSEVSCARSTVPPRRARAAVCRVVACSAMARARAKRGWHAA